MNRDATNVLCGQCARRGRWVIPHAFHRRDAPRRASVFIITRCLCVGSLEIPSLEKSCSCAVRTRGSGRGCGNPRRANQVRFSSLPRWPGESRQVSLGSDGSHAFNIGRRIEMSSSTSMSPLMANPPPESRLAGSPSINLRRSGCRTPTFGCSGKTSIPSPGSYPADQALALRAASALPFSAAPSWRFGYAILLW